MAGSTCLHCVAAGANPETVTWDDADDYNKHMAEDHGKTKRAVKAKASSGLVTAPGPRSPRQPRSPKPEASPRKPRRKK